MKDEAKKSESIAFTFGDPEPVLNGYQIQDMLECWYNGQYYETPFNTYGLAKVIGSNPYLPSALQFKKNQLLKFYIPNAKLSLKDADRLFLEFVSFGNAYLERIDNYFGSPLLYRSSIAKYTRRKNKNNEYVLIKDDHSLHEYRQNYICHISENDINQELYGVPEWMAVLQSALLNESATLFRRKYYNNGSHTGYILYMNDPNLSESDVEGIKKAIKDSKGPGNFKNLFLHAPNGKEKGVQIIPVNEVATKDDFFNIKSTTREDILAGMRIPPVLMGIIPSNTGGFGSPSEASQIYFENEILPLQIRISSIVNEWAGEQVISFYNPQQVPLEK